MLTMRHQLGVMSIVVRHIFPAFAPQCHGCEKPHSQMEKVIGFSSLPVCSAHARDASCSAMPMRLYCIYEESAIVTIGLQKTILLSPASRRSTVCTFASCDMEKPFGICTSLTLPLTITCKYCLLW